MKGHSNILEETVLFDRYSEKVSSSKTKWMTDLYRVTTSYLKDISNSFFEYDLYGENTSLILLDMIGNLLGAHVNSLSIGELELLIVSSLLNDIGLKYSDEDFANVYKTKPRMAFFWENFHPEIKKNNILECSINIRKEYLRSIHPFRIGEIIVGDEVLNKLFCSAVCMEITAQDAAKICESRVMGADELYKFYDTEYSEFRDIDFVFCSEIFRLANLLIFNEVLLPEVSGFMFKHKINKKIWKTNSEAVINFQSNQVEDTISYIAEFSEPNMECLLHIYIDRIDVELSTFADLKPWFTKKWKNFMLPLCVSRKRIRAKGYESGLLHFETYTNKFVFIRQMNNVRRITNELVNCSLERVIRRSTYESFLLEKDSRISLNFIMENDYGKWLKVDDNGLGISEEEIVATISSFHELVLKELQFNDITEHRAVYNQGNRVFMVILLSLLCGYDIDISTLFDKRNNDPALGLGVCFSVRGPNGFYFIRRKKKEQWGTPDSYPWMMTYEQYRDETGTSVYIRIDDEKELQGIEHDIREKAIGKNINIFYDNLLADKKINDEKKEDRDQEEYRNNTDDRTEIVFKRYFKYDPVFSDGIERFLSLFKDYLSSIRGIPVSFEQMSTGDGTLYMMKCDKEEGLRENFDGYVKEFEALIQNCSFDIEKAKEKLFSYGLNESKVEKYMKKIQVDTKRAMLDFQLRLEEELLSNIHDARREQLEEEIQQNVIIRKPSSVLYPTTVINNYGNYFNNPTTETIFGNSNHNEYDKQMMNYILEYAKEKTDELISELQLLKDEDMPPVEKKTAIQKLKGFLSEHVGDIAEVTVKGLMVYLDSKM